MINIFGNCWDHLEDADLICVLTNRTVINGHLSMGGGQAREAAELFPTLPEVWGHILDKDSPDNIWKPLQYGFYNDGNPKLVAFPTMDKPGSPGDLKLIEESAKALTELVDCLLFPQKVIVPRPGCGIGGLDYEVEVEPILAKYFDDRFFVITFATEDSMVL